MDYLAQFEPINSEIPLTEYQQEALQSTANYCFGAGFSSTLFARALNNTAQIVGIDVESSDDFYDMYNAASNLKIKALMLQLGYCVMHGGFGIRLVKDLDKSKQAALCAKPFTKVFDCNNLEDATIEATNFAEANNLEMLSIDENF